jgi:FkbM family methyltransferase
MPSARVSAGLHRAVLAEHLKALFERLDVGLVLDVGAHEGQYGAMLRGLGYDGPIASFEPVGSAFAVLAGQAEGDGRWDVHQLALGAADGTARIGVAASSDLSSLLQPTAYGVQISGGLIQPDRHEEVEVRALDGLRRDLDRRREGADVVVKIDVQGTELDVLAGMQGWLPDVAVVQLEVGVQQIYERGQRLEEVFAALEPLGFALTGVVPVTRDAALRIVELDCTFARPERLDPSVA